MLSIAGSSEYFARSWRMDESDEHDQYHTCSFGQFQSVSHVYIILNFVDCYNCWTHFWRGSREFHWERIQRQQRERPVQLRRRWRRIQQYVECFERIAWAQYHCQHLWQHNGRRSCWEWCLCSHSFPIEYEMCKKYMQKMSYFHVMFFQFASHWIRLLMHCPVPKVSECISLWTASPVDLSRKLSSARCVQDVFEELRLETQVFQKFL